VGESSGEGGGGKPETSKDSSIGSDDSSQSLPLAGFHPETPPGLRPSVQGLLERVQVAEAVGVASKIVRARAMGLLNRGSPSAQGNKTEWSPITPHSQLFPCIELSLYEWSLLASVGVTPGSCRKAVSRSSGYEGDSDSPAEEEGVEVVAAMAAAPAAMSAGGGQAPEHGRPEHEMLEVGVDCHDASGAGRVANTINRESGSTTTIASLAPPHHHHHHQNHHHRDSRGADDNGAQEEISGCPAGSFLWALPVPRPHPPAPVLPASADEKNSADDHSALTEIHHPVELSSPPAGIDGDVGGAHFAHDDKMTAPAGSKGRLVVGTNIGSGSGLSPMPQGGQSGRTTRWSVIPPRRMRFDYRGSGSASETGSRSAWWVGGREKKKDDDDEDELPLPLPPQLSHAAVDSRQGGSSAYGEDEEEQSSSPYGTISSDKLPAPSPVKQSQVFRTLPAATLGLQFKQTWREASEEEGEEEDVVGGESPGSKEQQQQQKDDNDSNNNAVADGDERQFVSWSSLSTAATRVPAAKKERATREMVVGGAWLQAYNAMHGGALDTPMREWIENVGAKQHHLARKGKMRDLGVGVSGSQGCDR
jgi:hypothetical protein